MRPSKPATEAERKVLWWFLIVLAVLFIVTVGFSWWKKSRECQTQCVTKTLGDGVLRFNSGGRFNLGTHCECTGVLTPDD
jgi:hypothetical protein